MRLMICHMCMTRERMCVCVTLCAYYEVFCLHTPSRARHSLMSVRNFFKNKKKNECARFLWLELRPVILQYKVDSISSLCLKTSDLSWDLYFTWFPNYKRRYELHSLQDERNILHQMLLASFRDPTYVVYISWHRRCDVSIFMKVKLSASERVLCGNSVQHGFPPLILLISTCINVPVDDSTCDKRRSEISFNIRHVSKLDSHEDESV